MSKARAAAAAFAVVAGLGVPAVLAVSQAPLAAAAAGTQFTAPPASSSPYALPVDSTGNPTALTVSGSGFTPGEQVYVEECDGLSPTSPNYDPNVSCDASTANAPETASSTGTVTFPAADPNVNLRPFRGISPTDEFNCLAPEDVKTATTPNANGSVTPIGAKTLNGEPIDTNVPSWTNCQLRLAGSVTATTGDQTYQIVAIANSGARTTSKAAVGAQGATSTYGDTVSIPVSVTGAGGTPTGTVSLSDLVNSTGRVTVTGCSAVPVTSGTATCTTTGLLAGSNALTASYSGDGSFAATTSAPVVTYTVKQGATTTALSSVPTSSANPGASVTFTAKVTGVGPQAPTGSVEFQSSGLDIGGCGARALTSGTATCTTSALANGTQTITAIYKADSNNATSTSSPESFLVGSLPSPAIAAVTGTPTTSTYPGSVQLSTTVTSTSGGATPTGTVNFESNGVTVAGCSAQSLSATGVATCTTTTLSPGSDNLTAVYSGNGSYAGATSTAATYTVAKATPTAALNSVPTTKAGTNSSVTFTDTLTGVTNGTTPSGTVAFSVGGTAITGCSSQTVSPTGTATCTTSFPSASTPTITATYSGDTNYSAGTAATENFTVVVLPTPTVTLSVAPPSGAIYGSSETLMATVTSTSGAAPTGSVTFQDGGTAISTACTSVALNSGSANCGPIVLPVGTDSLSAVYSGDTNYGGTTKTVSYPVSQATPTVSLSAVPATTQYQGGSVTLTAAVASSAGTPSGSVAFDVGGTALTACAAQTITAGQATCTTTALPVGTDSLTAVYSGDTNFTSVTSTPAVNYTVTPRTATSLSVMASPASPQVAGTTVTITASVAPATTGGVTPTGTISFTTGGAAINGCTNVTVDATGSASCATSNLPVGTDTVTATYSGDSSYIGSSGPVTYTITSPPVTTEQLPAGYHLVARDGGVFAFGGAGFYGSEGGQHINAPIVGLAESVDQQGYWLVGSDGGVYAFGDAPFLGSLGNIHLKAPIVGITPTSDGGGYWLVASDGGVFAFGDAGYFGSLGGVNLAKPVVGIASTPDDGGYWLVASDGGVFAFGDAPFLGSAGGTPLAKPVVGIAPTFDGGGYWLAASDGGVFAYGDAPFAGSAGGTALAKPVVGIAEAPEGGYRLVASDGGVFNYGGAQFFGSTGGLALQAPITGVASTGGTLIIVNEADEAAAVHHPSGLKERFTPKG